uniref:Uncharacterized protein n=1 Tax=Zea mays TaxID=4577 RepID=B4FFN6_MAIZE|nr:unknown [Zea mays]
MEEEGHWRDLQVVKGVIVGNFVR